MPTITTHADLGRTPQCPMCRHELLGPTTVYVVGIAFCHYCATLITTDQVARLIAWRTLPTAAQHWSTDKGLIFFTPDRCFPPRLSADMGHIFLHPAHHSPPGPATPPDRHHPAPPRPDTP